MVVHDVKNISFLFSYQMPTAVPRMRGIITILLDLINVNQNEHTFFIVVHHKYSLTPIVHGSKFGMSLDWFVDWSYIHACMH